MEAPRETVRVSSRTFITGKSKLPRNLLLPPIFPGDMQGQALASPSPRSMRTSRGQGSRVQVARPTSGQGGATPYSYLLWPIRKSHWKPRKHYRVAAQKWVVNIDSSLKVCGGAMEQLGIGRADTSLGNKLIGSKLILMRRWREFWHNLETLSPTRAQRGPFACFWVSLDIPCRGGQFLANPG